METFKNLYGTVKKTVTKGIKKVSCGVEKITNTAALYVKLNGVKNKLSEYYELLGKLTYMTYAQTGEEDMADIGKRIENLLLMIDGKRAEQEAIRDEIKRRKAEKDAKYAEKEETKEADEEPSEAVVEVELPADAIE